MEQSPLLPLREELAQVTPYGAPQLEVAARLNVNENPYSPSPEMIADITRAVSEAAAGLNRYPDRDFTRLREALAGYVRRESGLDFPVEQIWAANGSNEVMAQLLGAYAGPGRTVLGPSIPTRCIRSMCAVRTRGTLPCPGKVTGIWM